MKDQVVTVIRRFVPSSSLRGAWNRFSSPGQTKRWSDLEALYRVLILADPGAGKTFEALDRARKLQARGKKAFFIRIERIDSQFADAFEVGSTAEFDAWLQSTGEAWFFLDSVDEAQLETQRALEHAVRIFGARIQSALERAHIVITSRSDAWQGLSDPRLIQQHLPYGSPSEAVEPQGADTEDDGLDVFRLEPLKKDEIRLFAASHGIGDVEAFVAAIERGDLMAQAERPFDLLALIRMWQADRALGGRLQVLRRVVDLQLAPLTSAASTPKLSPVRARQGIWALAAAVTLTGRNGISLPSQPGHSDRIDAQKVLPDWSADELDALLRTGIFDDVVYGGVRFRHREMRELLTAEWALHRLEQPGARAGVEALFFRKIYDIDVIVPRLRPTLTWLILFDERVRDRALSTSSQLVTEGGDPSSLPLDIRRSILSELVRSMAADNERSPSLDYAAVARIASQDLADEIETLLTQFRSSDDAVFFLARFVWQGQLAGSVSSLIEVGIDPNRELYTRIAASHAVMEVGDDDQRQRFWSTIASGAAPMDRRLLAAILDGAPATSESVALLLQSLENLLPYKRYDVTGLRSALRSFIDRLPLMVDQSSEQPLLILIEGMNRLLEREPFHERGECRVSTSNSWLMGSALHAAERLIAGRSAAALQPCVTLILLKAPVLKYWGRSDDDQQSSKIAELVPRWHELNDRLYWLSISNLRAASSERLTDDWKPSIWDHFWSFGPADFDRVLSWVCDRPEQDDRLIALNRCIALYYQNGKPSEWLAALLKAVEGDAELTSALEEKLNPPPSRQEEWEVEHRSWKKKQERRESKRRRERAIWVDALRADPDRIRRPRNAATGDFTGDHYHLLLSLSGGGFSSQHEERARWEALIPEFGEEVALAFRDAAVLHWRKYQPQLRSEGADGSSTPYSLVFAMVGLAIEASPDATFPGGLSQEDARHAFRYIGWELNGFPRWFESLYRSYPEIGFEAVRKEIEWELDHSRDDQPMHYLLHDIVYHAPWLFADVAPIIADFLQSRDLPSAVSLGHALSILQRARIPASDLAQLAQRKVDGRVLTDQLPTWYALWVGNDPQGGIAALRIELETLEDAAASRFAEQFVTALIGSRHSGGGTSEGYKTVRHLVELYVLMHRFIRVSDDIERAGTGVYSPTSRDEAQDARNKLFALLAEIPGAETYAALRMLQRDHPVADYRAWMGQRAVERAVADADEPAWQDHQIADFEMATRCGNEIVE